MYIIIGEEPHRQGWWFCRKDYSRAVWRGCLLQPRTQSPLFQEIAWKTPFAVYLSVAPSLVRSWFHSQLSSLLNKSWGSSHHKCKDLIRRKAFLATLPGSFFTRFCHPPVVLLNTYNSLLLSHYNNLEMVTRSSWLNCALRDDEAVYWISIGHYEAVAVGNWWYWVSRGHSCLHILRKVDIWAGVTHAWQTDNFER